MRKPSIVYKGENVLLVRTRKGKGPVIIQSSGYTKTADAVSQSWIVTNLQTVPRRDRSNLSDPFIFNQKLPCYKQLDAEVIELYFLPECKGLSDAVSEFAGLFQRKFSNAILIGHSKGGLFMTAVLERLHEVRVTAIIITPTIGTVTGDEKLMLKQVSRNEYAGLFKNFVKFVIRTVGSRRPIDLDMTDDTRFMKGVKTYMLVLKRHNVLNIYARCPSPEDATIVDKIFMRFGKAIGLDLKKSDGMVEVENQRLHDNAETQIEIRTVHPMALKKSNDLIFKYIIKNEAY